MPVIKNLTSSPGHFSWTTEKSLTLTGHFPASVKSCRFFKEPNLELDYKENETVDLREPMITVVIVQTEREKRPNTILQVPRSYL